MKEGIHPKYTKAIITCACGNTFETASTKGNMQVDICNVCHPFYTGNRRFWTPLAGWKNSIRNTKSPKPKQRTSSLSRLYASLPQYMRRVAFFFVGNNSVCGYHLLKLSQKTIKQGKGIIS